MDWTVPGVVLRIIDGDTVLCRCDLGWHIHLDTVVRIAGINAPELSTQEGKDAKAYAETLIPAGTAVTIVSKKLLGAFDKYGRVLGDLRFNFPTESRLIESDFATAMLGAGKATVYT